VAWRGVAWRGVAWRGVGGGQAINQGKRLQLEIDSLHGAIAAGRSELECVVFRVAVTVPWSLLTPTPARSLTQLLTRAAAPRSATHTRAIPLTFTLTLVAPRSLSYSPSHSRVIAVVAVAVCVRAVQAAGVATAAQRHDAATEAATLKASLDAANAAVQALTKEKNDLSQQVAHTSSLSLPLSVSHLSLSFTCLVTHAWLVSPSCLLCSIA
jgi:hypothetical protein